MVLERDRAWMCACIHRKFFHVIHFNCVIWCPEGMCLRILQPHAAYRSVLQYTNCSDFGMLMLRSKCDRKKAFFRMIWSCMSCGISSAFAVVDSPAKKTSLRLRFSHRPLRWRLHYSDVGAHALSSRSRREVHASFFSTNTLLRVGRARPMPVRCALAATWACLCSRLVMCVSCLIDWRSSESY